MRESSKTAVKIKSGKNEEHLIRNLRLLGVKESDLVKEAKVGWGEIVCKDVNANSKLFYLVVNRCIEKLCGKEEYESVRAWYPPKTVNEQIEFKKAVFQALQKGAAQGVVPKNVLLSKASIMGDAPSGLVLEFLRALSEFALRTAYLQQYSKGAPLLQVALHLPEDLNPNDVNRFYLYPFVESSTCTQPSLPIHQIDTVIRAYQMHIHQLRTAFLNLPLPNHSKLITPQLLIQNLLEQRQLAEQLHNKLPANVLTENRAFDRRLIIDRHRQLWNEIQHLELSFSANVKPIVLKTVGQTDSMLRNWTLPQNISIIREFNAKCSQIQRIKCDLELKIIELKNIKTNIYHKIKQVIKVSS